MSEAIEKATAAKAAAALLAQSSAVERTDAILGAAQSVSDGRDRILAANGADMQRARANGMPGPMLDRLMLDDARIDGRRRCVIEIDRLHRAHPTFFACSGWSVQRS